MSKGRFGIHGGQYIPETLMNAINEKDQEIAKLQENNGGQKEIEKGENMNEDILRDFNIPTEPIINDEVKPVEQINEPVNQTSSFEQLNKTHIESPILEHII